MNAQPLKARLNRKERRAQQLLAHYATCERLAAYLGKPGMDGKKISVALWKIERDAHNAATAQCNGSAYNGQPYRSDDVASLQAPAFSEWEYFVDSIKGRLSAVLGQVPPGFFLNQDARGYALKCDPGATFEGKKLESLGLHRDMGGFLILSPEIDGN